MYRPLLLAALLPLTAHAAVATAPLEVSLTIKESCRVDRRDREPAPPSVRCTFDAPYRVRQHDGQPPPAVAFKPQPAYWEVIF
jgi:hypothetical protein